MALELTLEAVNVVISVLVILFLPSSDVPASMLLWLQMLNFCFAHASLLLWLPLNTLISKFIRLLNILLIIIVFVTATVLSNVIFITQIRFGSGAGIFLTYMLLVDFFLTWTCFCFSVRDEQREQQQRAASDEQADKVGSTKEIAGAFILLGLVFLLFLWSCSKVWVIPTRVASSIATLSAWAIVTLAGFLHINIYFNGNVMGTSSWLKPIAAGLVLLDVGTLSAMCVFGLDFLLFYLSIVVLCLLCIVGVGMSLLANAGTAIAKAVIWFGIIMGLFTSVLLFILVMWPDTYSFTSCLMELSLSITAVVFVNTAFFITMPISRRKRPGTSEDEQTDSELCSLKHTEFE